MTLVFCFENYAYEYEFHVLISCFVVRLFKILA